MLEITVTIDAPDLQKAIDRLADSISMIGSRVPEKTEQELSQNPNAPVVPNIPVVPDIPTVGQNPGPKETVWGSNTTVWGSNTSVTPAVVPTAPVEAAPAQPPVMNAPVEPVPAAPPAIDLETISRAGAALVDQGKMPEILAVLKKYGVEAVTQLQQDQFTAFAGDLRALGANI